jgi:hypothetical protein
MKPHKTQSPWWLFTNLGVGHDLRRFIHFLDEQHRNKLFAALYGVRDSAAPTFGELDTLRGCLGWAAIVLNCKAYYWAIHNLIMRHCRLHGGRSNVRKTDIIPLEPEQRREISMWLVVLTIFNKNPIERGLRRTQNEHILYSDASLDAWAWQWAGLFNTDPFPAPWAVFIKAHSEYRKMFIGFLEGLACLAGLRVAIPRCGHMSKLVVRVDNQGLMYQLRSLTARDPMMQPVIREVLWLTRAWACELQVEYVPSMLNTFTDFLGRSDQADFTDAHRVELAALVDASTAKANDCEARGQHRRLPAYYKDMLPYLEAERCDTLKFDTTWSPQRRDQLDALLDEFEHEGSFSRRQAPQSSPSSPA